MVLGKVYDDMMDSPEDIPTPHQLENIANEIATLDLIETDELDHSRILSTGSRRYNLNLQTNEEDLC
jgi:hypothetical protein